VFEVRRSFVAESAPVLEHHRRGNYDAAGRTTYIPNSLRPGTGLIKS
jgi:hypothetical protein